MGLFWPLSFSTLSGALKKFRVETRLAASPLAAKTRQASSLPSIMRECLVRFRHPMYVFFLFDGGALAVGGIQQFVRQLVDHSLFTATTGVRHDPADCQRRPAVRTDFDRHLVVRAAHAPGLHLGQWLCLLARLFEQLEAVVATQFLLLGERLTEDAVGSRLLGMPHHRVHELR